MLQTGLPVTRPSPQLSERDAKEFIVGEIVHEANRSGRPLSDTEREMLFFCEGAPDSARQAEVLDTFHRECDEEAYERRIAGLIRNARRRATGRSAARWPAAIERVTAGDHYLGVMLDRAERGESLARLREAGLLISLGVVVILLLNALLAWYLGHSPRRDERFFYVWVVVMAAALICLLGRPLVGARRWDDFISRIIDTVARTRKG